MATGNGNFSTRLLDDEQIWLDLRQHCLRDFRLMKAAGTTGMLNVEHHARVCGIDHVEEDVSGEQKRDGGDEPSHPANDEQRFRVVVCCKRCQQRCECADKNTEDQSSKHEGERGKLVDNQHLEETVPFAVRRKRFRRWTESVTGECGVSEGETCNKFDTAGDKLHAEDDKARDQIVAS